MGLHSSRIALKILMRPVCPLNGPPQLSRLLGCKWNLIRPTHFGDRTRFNVPSHFGGTPRFNVPSHVGGKPRFITSLDAVIASRLSDLSHDFHPGMVGS